MTTPRPGTPASRPDDVAALAAAARAGSREAFSALVDRTSARLLAFLRLRARGEEDAEELLQETYLRAWRRLELYDPERRFTTWLFTLGRHLTASRYRRLDPDPAREPDPERDGGEEADPARAAERAEAARDLWDLAEELLSPDARQALWLRYVEDLSAREIAAVLDRSETGVRVLLFRARQRLTPYLAAHAPDTVAEAPR